MNTAGHESCAAEASRGTKTDSFYFPLTFYGSHLGPVLTFPSSHHLSRSLVLGRASSVTASRRLSFCGLECHVCSVFLGRCFILIGPQGWSPERSEQDRKSFFLCSSLHIVSFSVPFCPVQVFSLHFFSSCHCVTVVMETRQQNTVVVVPAVVKTHKHTPSLRREGISLEFRLSLRVGYIPHGTQSVSLSAFCDLCLPFDL